VPRGYAYHDSPDCRTLRRFVKEFPHLRDGWEKHIPGKKDHYDYS